MKKILIKVLSTILATAVCLSAAMVSVGDGIRTETATVTATAQTLAAPAQEMGAEVKVDEKLPEPGTDEPAKVAPAEKAEDENPATKVLSQPINGGAFDDDPVTTLELARDFLIAYLTGMNNLTSRQADTGGDFPEYVYEYDDNDGNPHSIYLGMYFDEENQQIIGRNQQGALAFGMDFDLKQQMMYASYNGWERHVGFCELYDMIAPAAGVFYKTHRIKFEYDGRDWMVQLWKGLYFVVGSGAEIGVYNKPQSRSLEFYDCVEDDEMLEMSMRLLKDEQLLLEREPQKHWWMNGFVLSNGLYPPTALTLEGNIRFEDEGMKAAFLVPFEQLCEQEGIGYSVDNGLVSFVW